MSLDGILTQLGTLLIAIPTIGKVYTYDRIAVQPEQVRAVFGYTDSTNSRGWSVRAWMLDRASTEETRFTNVETLRRHTIRLTGYWEVNDPRGSRAAFRTMVETIATTFRAVFSLGVDAEWVEPPQVVTDGLVLLGETYLVHSLELTLVAQERVSP